MNQGLLPNDRVRRHVLLGGIVGVALAGLVGVYPASAYVVAPVLVAFFVGLLVTRPMRYGDLLAFGGILAAGGTVFLLGVAGTFISCVPTGDLCGGTPVLPYLGLAVALLATGSLIAVVTWQRARH